MKGSRAVVRFLRDEARVPLAVALATFLVFSGALRGGFVNWDDNVNFLTNVHYRGLGWEQVRWMLTSSIRMGHYMPLTWLTLGLDFTLWGMNPFGYHLTSLLLHCADAAVFYFVARRLLALARRGGGEKSRGALNFTAGLAALLFALHPLRVESVAWVTERRDVLSGLFYLLALLFYLKSAAAEDAPKSPRRLALSAVFFICSLLSKISGITLPLVLLVIDVYPLQRLPGDPRRWFSTTTRRLWLEKLLFLLPTIPAGLLAVGAEARLGSFRSLGTWGASERIATALFGASFYVWKTVAPLGLSPFYVSPDKLNPLAWPFLLSGSFVAAAGVAAYVVRRKWPAALAAWSCYLITLLPVSGLAQNGMQIAADRYTYLPCMGLALLAAAAVSRLRDERARRPWLKAKVAAGILLAASSGLTWIQVGVWRNSERLWRRALAVDPGDSLAHNNLGLVLADRGEIDAAIRQYRLALAARPVFQGAHNNLGMALAAQGKTDEAIAQYEQALQAQPEGASARNNLGAALAAQGRTDDAIRQYERSIHAQPEAASAHNNLGAALAAQGKPDEAIRQYGLALQAQPDLASAHNNLGAALAGQGKFDEAIRHFTLAVQAQPDYALARNNLGMVLAGKGRLDEAAEQFREAVRIDPGYEEARRNLAVILQQSAQRAK